MKNAAYILFYLVVNVAIAQPQYEWNVDNTYIHTGERIVAVIDAGSIGNYDGAEIIGTVVDNNGNWGYNLPTVTPFRMYVRFSGTQSYKLVQGQKTNYITLRLRKINTSLYHLTANCPFNHRGMRVFFQQVEGYATVTMGSPTIIDPSGELVISEPEYQTSFSGKVGINTSSPDAELSVKGIIHTQEVKVDLAGSVAPDFVFEEDYPLPEIDDVAKYVKKEKHLPGFPSAQEMEASGVNLKEMNLLLLQKVEELTLHIIEMNERIEKLEKVKSDY